MSSRDTARKKGAETRSAHPTRAGTAPPLRPGRLQQWSPALRRACRRHQEELPPDRARALRTHRPRLRRRRAPQHAAPREARERLGQGLSSVQLDSSAPV